MIIIRFEEDKSTYIGIVNEDKIYKFEDFPLEKTYNDINDFITNHTESDFDILSKDFPRVHSILSEVKILSPFGKTVHDVLCVGLNYSKHIQESKSFNIDDVPEHAIYFSKRSEFISGHQDTIENDANIDSAMDYETELAVIIGKKGKNISYEEAEDYIFGYTILNDYSARLLQTSDGQWFKGKSLDVYTAMGPIVVTKDELDLPLSLDISTKVNDELRQNSNTKFMLRDVSQLIHELSQGITLVPGDIIATGTPEGVGGGFNPAKYLKSGDKVVSYVEGIGELINYIG